MTPTIWMISGLHDPRWSANVLENFQRQEYRDKRLVLVENGAGIGASRILHLGPRCTLLTSDTGPAAPLNAALAWLRAHASPGDWFAKCDADDYYGPGYLDSLLPAIDVHADYAGRSSLYIKTTENRLWYVEGKPEIHICHGPTIAGRISMALDFPVVADWGEDAEWCIDMYRAGASPHVLAPEHFCYQRWSDYEHTWPCTDLELRTSWAAEFIDLGPFDADIVDGVKPRPSGGSLGIAEFAPEHFMPLRLLRDQLALLGSPHGLSLAQLTDCGTQSG